MKTCPYCAEEIQDAAIVCRYCGKDILNIGIKKQKAGNQILKFLLHPLFLILLFMYVSVEIGKYKPLSSTGSLLSCGVMIVLLLIAANIRGKIMTDDEMESEKKDAEYWAGRGR